MKLHAYSSLTAFLAHYRALRRQRTAPGAARLSAEEKECLAEMENLLGLLEPVDLALLESEPSPGAPEGAAGRRKARAELKLRRELMSRDILTG
jgi:hypothetical protein